MTKIEWTEQTWNPLAGCKIVSPGCTNCYAMRQAHRLAHNPKTPHYHGTTQLTRGGPVWTGKMSLAPEQVLTAPMRRKKPTDYFVNSMSDLFAPGVPDEWIDRIFAVMALCPQHTFKILTKRADRMRVYVMGLDCDGARRFNVSTAAERTLGTHYAREAQAKYEWERVLTNPIWPLPNVWLGVSVEDQKRAEERVPDLLRTPAAVRFISAEPLLGSVQLDDLIVDDGRPGEWHVNALDHEGGCVADDPDFGCNTIDQVIVGGESGPGARPMHPDWARNLRDQCEAAGTAFFFKQWGAWLPWEPESAPEWRSQNGHLVDGHILFPEDMDNDPTWDDGLSTYTPGFTCHAAFQRVGKKAAGRKLDGVVHDGYPASQEDQT